MSDTTWLAIGIVLLAFGLIVVGYVVIELIKEVVYTKDELQEATDHNHAKCMAAVMAFVGDEFAAQVLTVAAEDYASPTSHGDLDRISRLKFKPGGDPVPTIWLHERAERLRIMNAQVRGEVAS